MKKMIVLLLVIFIAGCSASATTNDATIGGAIRNDGTGWKLIKDSTHSPMGISKVSIDKDHIRIDHKVGASSVVTFIVTPDETMTKEGYTVGISGGVSFSNIFIYDSSKNIVDPEKYVNEWGNIWIYGLLMK